VAGAWQEARATGPGSHHPAQRQWARQARLHRLATRGRRHRLAVEPRPWPALASRACSTPPTAEGWLP
ncbi:MAG: hypothetical protein ACRDY2_06155, partial [Acidimicrobiales bacterium]